MKNIFRVVFPLALLVIASQLLAATGQHLQLREVKTKKIYNGKTDASGKFSFDKIEAGTYQLVLVLPEGTTPENTESCTIDIQSFSWGVSNMGTGGHGGGGGAGKVSSPGSTTDDDNDGASDASARGTIKRSKSNLSNNKMINTKPVTAKAADMKPSQGGYYIVVMEDLVISGAAGETGDCDGMCFVAINEKGLPGEKKPVKDTKQAKPSH